MLKGGASGNVVSTVGPILKVENTTPEMRQVWSSLAGRRWGHHNRSLSIQVFSNRVTILLIKLFMWHNHDVSFVGKSEHIIFSCFGLFCNPAFISHSPISPSVPYHPQQRETVFCWWKPSNSNQAIDNPRTRSRLHLRLGRNQSLVSSKSSRVKLGDNETRK